MAHKKIARYWKKGEARWRWSLYYSPYAGYGVRSVRRYQKIHRRWYMFFDLPIVGGLELYIQDVP